MTVRPGLRILTAVLISVQALLGGVVGLVLLGLAKRHPHRGLGAAGFVALAVAGGLVAVAVGVTGARPWARHVGLTLEALIAVVAVTRIGARPVASVVSLAMAAAVAALLSRAEEAPPRTGRAPQPGTGVAWDPGHSDVQLMARTDRRHLFRPFLPGGVPDAAATP